MYLIFWLFWTLLIRKTLDTNIVKAKIHGVWMIVKGCLVKIFFVLLIK